MAKAKPKPHRKTINLTEEDLQEFSAAMEMDGDDQLGPWMVSVVRVELAKRDAQRKLIVRIDKQVSELHKRLLNPNEYLES